MKNILLTLLVLSLFSGCRPGTNQNSESERSSSDLLEVPPITLKKAPQSPAYADAALTLNTVEIKKGDEINKVSFDFNVDNYELGVQTEGASERGIANSGKGQHIHMIINNGPYSAHYENTFEKEMKSGSYVVLAFLSRSYHESVKNDRSFFVDVINIGDVKEKFDIDLAGPHMFFSRPKGTYSGDDTKLLMLDFFLLNSDLSPDGNKVIATINDAQFIIDEWVPYYIKGLTKEEVTIKLEFIDAEDKQIPSPFSPVERTVILE